MELQPLKAKTRHEKGKNSAHRIRAQGRIPAVLYGGGGDSLMVDLDLKEFTHLVHGRTGEHAIVQLNVEDDPEWDTPAMLKDVQHHPVRGRVLHADFQRIRLDERIRTQVPVVLSGQSAGEREGGVLDQTLREVDVECLALEVPEQFELDVTELTMGDSIHVHAIKAPEGVAILTDPDRTIASVHAPRMVIEAEPEEEAEAGEVPEIGEEETEEEATEE
jgi:large subunit ribosomal protein L25